MKNDVQEKACNFLIELNSLIQSGEQFSITKLAKKHKTYVDFVSVLQKLNFIKKTSFNRYQWVLTANQYQAIDIIYIRFVAKKTIDEVRRIAKQRVNSRSTKKIEDNKQIKRENYKCINKNEVKNTFITKEALLSLGTISFERKINFKQSNVSVTDMLFVSFSNKSESDSLFITLKNESGNCFIELPSSKLYSLTIDRGGTENIDLRIKSVI